MRRLGMQIALAFVWASLWESFELAELISGFLLATVLTDGFSYLSQRRTTTRD